MGVIPEMIREMKKPEDFHKAWAISQGIVVPLYIIIGLWGFYLFGTFVSGTNLFNNFKNNAWTEVYFLVSTVTGYMPLCYGQILFFLKLELHLGVLPTDWFTVSNPDTNRVAWIPPAIFRLCWRGGMLAIWLFLSEMLIGLSIFLLFSLVSAITSAAFSFYLPYVFSMMSFRLSAMRKLFYLVAIAISLALSGIGVYAAASQMSSMPSAKLFAFEETCLSGSFFVGQFDGKNYKGDGGGYSHAKGNGTFHDTFYFATCGNPDTGVDGNINCAQACYGGTCCWKDQNTEASVQCPPDPASCSSR